MKVKACLKIFYFGLILTFLSTQYVAAQACNCKYTIPLSQWNVDAKALNILPGDVVCIEAGVRNQLRLVNFVGTAAKPIIIKNCGGLVDVKNSNTGYAIIFATSRYVHLTGTGNSSYTYGIRAAATKSGTNSLIVGDLSSDFEIDHVEIPGAGFAGIVMKTDPRCDLSANRGVFTMYNLSVHDNYIHDVNGEGFYIGNSYYNGYTDNPSCKGTKLLPHDIVGCKVYNNIIKNTGAEAIQVGCAVSGNEVYNNMIENYGQDPFANYQNNGIQLGVGTSGLLYNNFIKNGPGNGIILLGFGNIKTYNNVIVNAGTIGIYAADVTEGPAGSGFIFTNNTIIDPGTDGIKLGTTEVIMDRVLNNIIVSPGSGKYLYKTYPNMPVEEANNLYEPVLANVKFVNPANFDYHLASTSTAVDKGKNVASHGVTLDFESNPRPAGASYDIGAFEFQSSANTPPVANAGADRTITLPTVTLTLTGSATDPGGSIASYAWTKQSGPLATLTGANTATLALSALLQGTYVFRLTVTDNGGLTAYDEVSVTVAPLVQLPPVANAGADKTITLPTNTVTLTGSGSDPDGTIASYAWTKQSGPAATLSGANTATLALSALVQGTYVFRFTVTDNNGLTAYDEASVTVTAQSLPPVANAGVDKTITLPTNTVTLTGSGSDSDGTIASYAWTKQSGPSATLSGANTATLALSALVQGTYVFRLTVTDNSGLTAYNEASVTVAAQSLPPIANAGADKTVTLPTTTVTLTSTCSDPDGSIVSYAWTKQSGPTATLGGSTTSTLALSALLEGSYVFRLTVTDNNSLTAFDEVSVTVSQPPASSIVYRVNAGGNEVVDTPMNWAMDKQTAKSPYLDPTSANYTRGGTSWSGTNTTGAPNGIFGPHRYDPGSGGGPMQWNFPVANGSYQVNLFFAETPYAGGATAAGQRVFHVNIEGTRVLSNYDIYASVGMGAAKKSYQVTVSDGVIDLDFIKSVSSPQVNGIEIVSNGVQGTSGRSSTEFSEDQVKEEETMNAMFSIYPNPVRDRVTIEFSEKQNQITVVLMDITGRKLYEQQEEDSPVVEIDFNSVSIPTGIFVIVVKSDQGIQSRKMLKQ